MNTEMTTRETEILAANAALEAEVMRLRNALETFIAEHEECKDSDRWKAQMCSMEDLHVADEVLSTPFTPTALNELIEKVERLTIERCAERASFFTPYVGNKIRALPTDQIKLDELL